jgi:galacturan 1,4-alpha-galacturonidase
MQPQWQPSDLLLSVCLIFLLFEHFNFYALQQPSKIKISKVSFNNIRGTSAYPLAVILVCSKHVPCQNVEVGNIDLAYKGPLGPITTKCANVKPIFKGTQKPEICKDSAQSS